MNIRELIERAAVARKLPGIVAARFGALRQRFDRHFRYHFPGYVVGLLLFVFFLIYFWPKIFITVNSGEAAVLYRRFTGGTVVDRVYGEGFHIIFPWNIMTIYNVRLQTVPHQMEVLTNMGLKVKVSMSIRYRPEVEVLGVLHQLVGPDYLNKIVIPEVESTLRTVLGRYGVEEIYMTKKGVIQKVVNESLEQVSQRFVKIDNVMITEVTLPPKIREAIETKLEEQQVAEAYKFRLQREEKEADRKRLEAAGIRDYNNMIESSLSEKVLKWKGVEATNDISKSQNAKIIIIGGGRSGLPVTMDIGK